MQHRQYSFFPSSENTMWNGFGYLPFHSGSSTCAILRHLRGSGSSDANTEQLFSRRLFIMHRNGHPAKNQSRAPASGSCRTSPSNDRHRTFTTVDTDRCESLLNCRKATGSHRLSASRMAIPPHSLYHGGGPTALRMPDQCRRRQSTRMDQSPGNVPSSTNSSPIGTISHSIFWPLVPR